ncbi:MAG: hypothetical protein GF381_02205 [Candidatus Pacebacteria bacterium]|nr:hypothetical protein [Candidatus Paceibacterota bacterium]
MKLLKKNLKQFKQLSLTNKLYVVAAGLTVLVFATLAVASVFLQKQLKQETFDIRQEAARQGGVVELSLAQPSGTEFEVNQPQQLSFSINTNSTNIDGFELSLALTSDPASMLTLTEQDLNITINHPGLTAQDLALTEAGSGYQLKIIVLTTDPNQPFNSSSAEPVMQLSFTPTQTGSLQVLMDPVNSVALTHHQIEDQLNLLGDYQYQVVETQNQSELNPISWQTDYASLSAADFSLTTLQDETFLANAQVELDSDPYDPTSSQDNYTTLEVGPWQENGQDVSLVFEFYKDSQNWWLDKIRFARNETYTDFTPEMTARLGQTFQLSGAVSYQSTDGSAQLNLQNLNLEAFLDSPYCGNDVCEFGEASSSCPNDCSSSNNCNVPTNLSLEHQLCPSFDGQVSLSWSGISDPGAEYLIELAQDTNFSNPLTYQAESTQLTETGLTDGYWYARVRVNQAESCQVDPSWSEVLRFEVNCDGTEPGCEYVYLGDWSQCVDGWQTQSYQVVAPNCPEPPWENWHRPCMTQCAYQCADWSQCGPDQIQTRQCTAVNQPCWDYSQNNSGQPYLEQRYCNLSRVDDLLFASYEACWYKPSDGHSTYIAWLTDSYPEVGWVDISPERDFSSLANKDVSNATTQAGYGITTAQGFEWTDGRGSLELYPDQTYYARLYYRTDPDQDFQHSRSASFRINQCAGDPNVAYQQCNQACTDNHDCASNLFCDDGRCRLAADPTDEDCFIPGQAKSCAQWCADDRECGSGLTCWYNYCRNPKNIDITVTDEQQISLSLQKARETNCADWSSTDQDYYRYYYYALSSTNTKGGINTSSSTALNLSGCNEYCRTNRDCEPNHRCYENQCRLAINPEDELCLTEGQAAPTTSPTQVPDPQETQEASPEATLREMEQGFKDFEPAKQPQTDANWWTKIKTTISGWAQAVKNWFAYLFGRQNNQQENQSDQTKTIVSIVLGGIGILVLIALAISQLRPKSKAHVKKNGKPEQLQNLEKKVKPATKEDLNSPPPPSFISQNGQKVERPKPISQRDSSQK